MLSLVQTSQNRKLELQRFVNSINLQIDIEFHKIQYIFLDQGDNFDSFTELNKSIDF